MHTRTPTHIRRCLIYISRPRLLILIINCSSFATRNLKFRYEFWNNLGGKRYYIRRERSVAQLSAVDSDREAIICLGSIVPHRQFSRSRCAPRLFRAFRARSARPIAVYFPATGIHADRACCIVNARERALRRAIQSMAESGDAAARTCLPVCSVLPVRDIDAKNKLYRQ